MSPVPGALDEYPRANFFLGLGHIRLWDWKSAAQCMKKFLESKTIDPIERKSTETFLASCLLHGYGKIQESRELLESVIERSVAEGHHGIRRRAMILLVQNYFFDDRCDKGFPQLETLEELCREFRDDLMLSSTLKWKALYALKEDPTSTEAAAMLQEVRKSLRQNKQWERLRAIDLYEAMIRNDELLFSSVWHGSPYPALRERIRTLPGSPTIPANHDWLLEPDKAGRASEPVVVRVADGWNTLNGAFLKEGQVQQRLLAALAGDRYQPLPLALLHERIYPGDHFSLLSSATRVHQAIHRLRDWLNKNRIPLQIREDQGLFSLAAKDRPCVLRLGGLGERHPSARQNAGLRVVQTRFGSQQFTVQELARVLRVSRPTAFRWIEEIAKDGLADRQAMLGKATYYRLRDDTIHESLVG